MRFMITAAPDPKAPVDAPQVDEKLLATYMRYNEEMHKAGVLLASEGLNPAGKGARLVISKGKRVVIDGPFAESKELVGGFYLIEVKSLDEAIEWAKRCPIGHGGDGVLTIHPMTELSDLPPAFQKIILETAPAWSAAVTRKTR